MPDPTPAFASGRLTATCVTRAEQPRTARDATPSGIDKAPTDDGVVLGQLGVEGDRVLDTAHHGGVDKAVYAYADEDASMWAERLKETVPPGRFGENLRTSGVAVSDAVLGTRWRIGGTVLLEVAEPRVPCSTFQHHMGDRSGWVRDFTREGRVGAYLRVLVPGRVRPGDALELVDVLTHGVTVRDWFLAPTPVAARALLDADWALPGAVDEVAQRVLSNVPGPDA